MHVAASLLRALQLIRTCGIIFFEKLILLLVSGWYAMDCQDWEVVTVRAKSVKSSGYVGPRVSSDVVQARKLDDADIVKVKQLSKESRQEIVSRRSIAKMTQVQLNQACQFPLHTINKIESGQLSPSISQLNTLNRVLKTGLKYEQ